MIAIIVLAGCTKTSESGPSSGNVDASGNVGSLDTARDQALEALARVPQDLCVQGCAVVSEVGCLNQPAMDVCVQNCVKTTLCIPEAIAYNECVVSSGSQALLCEPSLMLAMPKPGYCSQESQTYAACLAAP